MNTTAAITFFAAIVVIPLDAHAAPPAPLNPTVEVHTRKQLRDRLEGTLWLHKYKGGEFKFGFGKSGFIEQHDNWKGTKWKAVSASEVMFTGTTGATMSFKFNKDATTFTNIDWDKARTPTTGRIVPTQPK